MSSRVKIGLGDDWLFAAGAVSVESSWVLTSVSIDMSLRWLEAMGFGEWVGHRRELFFHEENLSRLTPHGFVEPALLRVGYADCGWLYRRGSEPQENFLINLNPLLNLKVYDAQAHLKILREG